MGDGESISESIDLKIYGERYFQIVRKVVHKDHTKLSILAAAYDGGDDTRENDDGT